MLQKEFGNSFGFTILIGDAQHVLHTKSFGFRDTAKTLKTDKKTVFNIASVSKAFTATGIFHLIEHGQIALTDTIGKFFSAVPSDKRKITISHLLSHLSGFDQNYVCDGRKNAAEALRALLRDSLVCIPGEAFNYSNENYEMLALIIEKVSGKNYTDFISKTILKPLKMKNTFFWEKGNKEKNSANKNRAIPDSVKATNWGYIGSGGIFSTPADLYKFWNAIESRKIIAAASYNLIFAEHFKTKSGLSIGYGWYINNTTEWNSRELWARGNEDWGHNAVIRWFPEKQKVIIVCTNSGEIGDKNTTGNRLISLKIASHLFK